MHWTIHLAARQPGKAVVAVVVVILALFGVRVLASPFWHGGGMLGVELLSALLLVGSIAEFLFPVTYSLDADGAHMRHLGSHRLLPWSRIRRIYLRPSGIKLSPLSTPTWIEAYRGVMLRGPDRAAMLAQVRAWVRVAGVQPDEIEDV